MSNNNTVFSQIHSMGKLPDGRIIDRVISYPLGADYDQYTRIDDQAVTAYGSLNCRTIGTPFKPKRKLSP